jgi:glycosyltransferase EpsD
LDKIFSAFDIYVHTSLPGGAEVLPYTCLYAMSFNLPLIITNTGDMSALIQNEKNGYLLNDTQPDNLAVKLDNLVKNKSIRQAMGNESRKIVTGFFTEERMIDEILYIYTIEFPFKW